MLRRRVATGVTVALAVVALTACAPGQSADCEASLQFWEDYSDSSDPLSDLREEEYLLAVADVAEGVAARADEMLPDLEDAEVVEQVTAAREHASALVDDARAAALTSDGVDDVEVGYGVLTLVELVSAPASTACLD